MRAKIQKWGNSLAVRIPKALAEQSGIGQDSTIDLRLIDGSLVITPIDRDELSQLLDGITPENLHDEVDTGSAVDREAW